MIVRQNTGRFLVCVVCKVCSSRIGCKSLWICCQGTSNYLDLLWVECLEMGYNLSGLHKCFIEDKEIRVVSCKQLQRWNGIKKFSGKWRNGAFQPCFFPWLRFSLPYPIPSSVKHSQTKNVLHFKIHKKYCNSTLYNAEHGFRVNPVSQKNLCIWISELKVTPCDKLSSKIVISQAKLCRFCIK